MEIKVITQVFESAIKIKKYINIRIINNILIIY